MKDLLPNGNVNTRITWLNLAFSYLVAGWSLFSWKQIQKEQMDMMYKVIDSYTITLNKLDERLKDKYINNEKDTVYYRATDSIN